MKKSILNIGKTLNKAEQKSINGGAGCPQIDPRVCSACGGYSLFNGCCLGDQETWSCINGY
ncbi:MAG: hypothetical protein JKY02_07910 [Flavobacteriaceae bacterium]|nr:hypothetical protein [Flavobacteriaceae bacterium]